MKYFKSVRYQHHVGKQISVSVHSNIPCVTVLCGRWQQQ